MNELVLGTYSQCWVALSNLEAGGESWSCLKLTRHTLLMPRGGLPHSEQRQRRSGWGEGRCEAGGGKGMRERREGKLVCI